MKKGAMIIGFAVLLLIAFSYFQLTGMFVANPEKEIKNIGSVEFLECVDNCLLGENNSEAFCEGECIEEGLEEN